MYLHSFLKEENATLYEINVPNAGNDNTPVCFNNIRYAKKDRLDLEGIYYYTDGFFIVETTFNVNTPSTNLLTKRGEYIQISLLLTGKVATFKEQYNKVKNLEAGLLQLVFRSDCEVAMEMPAEKEPLNYVRIFISRDYYLSLLNDEKWVTNWVFHNDVQHNNYVHFGVNLIPINHAVLETISNLLNNTYTGITKKHYTELRLRELFFLLYTRSTTGKNIPLIENETLVKLESARAYLATHFSSPPTIKQLSKIVLLNELKLKTGFKEKFGTTIHDYTTQLRMKTAKKMLAENQPVNEVSAYLGYKNVSHFITSFKKSYGITPKQSILRKGFNSLLVYVLTMSSTCFEETVTLFTELPLLNF